MANHAKRIVSAALCISMLVSLVPYCFAAEANADTSGERSYFDFDASEYEVRENDGSLKVKIVRRGGGNAEADVSLKAADLLSSYGDDYEMLDSRGKAYEKVLGKKPSASDFEYDGNADDSSAVLNAAKEGADSTAASESEEGAESNTDSTNTEANADVNTKADADADTEGVNPEKARKTTGSPLRDAQAAYLNVTESEEDTETKSAVKTTLDDMYGYFLEAEGAEGVVHFKKGETEKTVTINVFDNDIPEQNKIFMLALMGTDNDETMTAPNATAYVTIIDDEQAEKAQFDLDDSGVTLTANASEGYVTVRRSGGTQYFATVYVSTVKDTADDASYESFEYKPVAFVPGETEKKVEVAAYDFSKDAKFGVRLEAETSADVGNYYATVNILSDGQSTKLSADSALLMAARAASNVTLGSKEWSPANGGIAIPGGWKKEISGDGSAWESNGDLFIKQYKKKGHSMWVSNNKLNLIGNKSVTYSSYITNPTRGFDTRYQSYATFFETDSDQTFQGSLDGIRLNGNSNWQERTLEFKNAGDAAYIKFSNMPCSAGYDNVQSQLDWVRFNYAKYNISPQKSVENFNRNVYDFTQGTPNVYNTYYEGESNRVYNPGGIVIKRDNGDTVSAFYGNNTERVTISSADEEKNNAKGIRLKGVYFAKNNLTDHTIYNGSYTTKNVYYVAAENGKLTFTPNQDFIKTLRDKGVIGGVHSDEAFKIYPVFEQEYVEFHFENSDRDDSKSATRGKFDKSNKASYIVNVLEAYDNGQVQKGFHANWLDYYYIKVPKYSVIRVQTQPISTRMANGVYWWNFDGSKNGILYYKEGDIISSGTSPSGETIKETDYAKADIIATENMGIKPATGEQSFTVSYFPTETESIPDVYKGENGLTNAVVQSDSLTSGAAGEESGTDKNGRYVFKNPFIGMDWSLTAIAPNGYYTQWVNMTGDEDEDGYISPSEALRIRNRSSMPDEVYGNTISGKLDQDNFRLNYYFLPKTSAGSGVKTGRVVRAPENFYQLANNIKSDEDDIPISAYVDIGGFRGITDANGRYSILCNDLPSAGNVSTTITSVTAEDDFSYNTVSKLQRDTYIKLDALSKFKATGISVNYDKTKGAIADDFITVNDDTLTVTASVSSDSAIVPTGAHFFIYDESGTPKYELDSREGYTTKVERNGNELYAYLSFNPSRDMVTGYKLYVQFEDQNGKLTNSIDLGYFFTSKLNLAEFIFPLFGSSSLEDTIRSGYVEDIIGDPLGDLDIGKISAFDEESYSYTPSGIDKKNAQNYTWQKTDYRFGFSDEFYRLNKNNNKKNDEAELKEYLKKLYDGKSKGVTPPEPSKYKTKSRFKWSVTPSIGFNLTLSSRRDGNTYFEDLVFYLKVDFEVSASQKIKLPIGLSILVKGKIDGDVAGVYHMYVDYQDSYETEDAVKYTTEDFGMFKKFNNSVRREGYIFLDPKISVALGVGLGIIFVTGNASFSFDMDFQFTEIGTNSYGDMRIDLGWGIQLFNFEVYTKSLWNYTTKLFNTEGTNGHIDFDYNSESTLSLMSLSDYFSIDDDEKLVLDKPMPRVSSEDSEWLSEANGGISLMSIDASQGTTESKLMDGFFENPYVKLAKLDNGKILMVFIGDDGDRSVVNKRTLFYSIGDGTSWSVPQIVEDDRTLDDYPNLSDLGDGRILITWSSAGTVLPDGATVEDAAKDMNIHAAFFDKNTCELSEPMKVTKTTTEEEAGKFADYSADTMANAAYDKATGKLILYYTKTEYEDMSTAANLKKAYSANAYMFYDDTTKSWSSADGYTAEELSGMTDEEKEMYKKGFYGQRLLDTRINKGSDVFPRVIDTTSISYNGLALFAWTTDWDGDLDTLYDRDVFMQIYNFAENSFTHIFRVTSKTSAYSSPKFARSDNATYLFYGQTSVEEVVKTGEGSKTEEQLAEHGSIKYLNVSDLIKNNRFTKISDNENEYYIFKYKRDAYTFDKEQNKEVKTTEEVLAEAETAAECDNPMDFDVNVLSGGQMYLFWTDSVGDSRQIMCAIYNSGDGTEDEYDEDNSETKPDTDIAENHWSEPVMLTNGGGDNVAGVYYSGFGEAVVDGKIYALGAKKVKKGTGDEAGYEPPALVALQHTPYSKLKAESIKIDNEIPQPLSEVTLCAEIKNEGLETKLASAENPIPVTFTMNGENPVTVKIEKPIPGGMTANVKCSMTLPEDISNIEFAAYVDGSEKAKTTLEQKSDIKLENSKITRVASDGYNPEKVVYSAVLKNVGNADAANIMVKATTSNTELADIKVDSLAANEERNIEAVLDIPDSAYTINNDGAGSAAVTVTVSANNEKITDYSETVKKLFSIEAINALSNVTEVKFADDGKFSMKVNEKKDIQPEITAGEGDSLMVMWLESSDTNVAHVNYDNMIVADGAGTATFTGIVVPSEEKIEFASDRAQNTDWRQLIPSNKLITAEMTVSVADVPNRTRKDGGRGSSSGDTQYTLTFNAENGSESGELKVDKDGTVSNLPAPVREGYTFGGWYTDKELTIPFTEDTKVTSDMTLYAKWIDNEITPDDYLAPFKDVKKSDWFAAAVKYVYDNKLFAGTTEDEFAPYDSLTRAMLVTVLWRAEGMPQTDYLVPFNDVESGGYYEEALRWAAGEGIVQGISETEFAPYSNITREQIAAIVFRYAKLKGIAPEGAWAIRLDYNDISDISDWAAEAVMFCKLKGIMTGDDTNSFNPKNDTSRAEAAAIVQRFLNNAD